MFIPVKSQYVLCCCLVESGVGKERVRPEGVKLEGVDGSLDVVCSVVMMMRRRESWWRLCYILLWYVLKFCICISVYCCLNRLEMCRNIFSFSTVSLNHS